MQFTLPQLVSAILIAMAALIVVWAYLRKHPNAPIIQEVQKAERALEDYTDRELLKLAREIFDHLSDDSSQQEKIARGNALIAEAADDAARRNGVRTQLQAIAMGGKLGA